MNILMKKQPRLIENKLLRSNDRYCLNKEVVMNKEEAVDRLYLISTMGDLEIAHIEADKVLLDFLDSNDFGDVAKAWENAQKRVGFWYA